LPSLARVFLFRDCSFRADDDDTESVGIGDWGAGDSRALLAAACVVAVLEIATWSLWQTGKRQRWWIRAFGLAFSATLEES
ncbi:hypothetical protein BHM03_00061977, partial [Ensete ventricosum]